MHNSSSADSNRVKRGKGRGALFLGEEEKVQASERSIVFFELGLGYRPLADWTSEVKLESQPNYKAARKDGRESRAA